MGWYITIMEEMRDLGLKGNELIVYAFINGYSQEGNGCYFGGLKRLMEVCGIASKHTAIAILRNLIGRGLIERTVTMENKVAIVSYKIVHKMHQGGAENALGECNNCTEGSAENAPNNKIDNKYIKNTLSPNKRVREVFKRPTLEEVRAYCAERGNNVDAEQFVAYYESNGWMVGRNPMKDWKASVRSWEVRERKEPQRGFTAQPQKESVFQHNLREVNRMMGTSFGKKEDYDEQ